MRNENDKYIGYCFLRDSNTVFFVSRKSNNDYYEAVYVNNRSKVFIDRSVFRPKCILDNYKKLSYSYSKLFESVYV